MGSEKEELRKLFKKQIEVENKIVDLANLEADETDNILIASLIRGIALDSIKHASLLGALNTLLSGATPLIEEKRMEDLEKHIVDHMKLEEEAVKAYEEQLKIVKDKRIELVLNYLVADEKRHHSLLKRIHRWIIQPQTLTEDDLWDMYWKDSMFHGSPGG